MLTCRNRALDGHEHTVRRYGVDLASLGLKLFDEDDDDANEIEQLAKSSISSWTWKEVRSLTLGGLEHAGADGLREQVDAVGLAADSLEVGEVIGLD